jgi:hypothetical protein
VVTHWVRRVVAPLSTLVLLATVLSNLGASFSVSYTAAAAPTPTEQAVPTASRWSVPAGSQVTVSAGGFQPGSLVSVSFVAGSARPNAPARFIEVGHVNRLGHLSISVNVPRTTPAGWDSVLLSGTAGGRAASDEVAVHVTAPRAAGNWRWPAS